MIDIKSTAVTYYRNVITSPKIFHIRMLYAIKYPRFQEI